MSQKEEKTVLSSRLSGGPHGIGDPNDKTLRGTEEKVLIPNLVRERARKIKCIEEASTFGECCKNTGVLSPFKCRAETDKLKGCMGKWFYDEDFVNECKDIYLEQRSEYRRTGISKKQRDKQRAEEGQ